MSCLMPCIYSDSNHFLDKLYEEPAIQGSFCTAYDQENPAESAYEKMTPRVSISFYSLNRCQKGTALTLAALAIIMLLVGVSSVAGANFIGTKAAFAMIGVGGGAFVIVAGTMSINHLIFVKQVGHYLRSLNKNQIENWKDPANYPGNGTWAKPNQNQELSEAFSHTFDDGKAILARRYGVLGSGLKFYIEFHRTVSIREERMDQKSHKA